MKSEPLLCPKCATSHGLDQELCPSCGQPLVYHGEPEDKVGPGPARLVENVDINPEFSVGELMKVGWGRNQAQAEFVQNLLAEYGIPSILRRSAGFDVPDFLAAGPRDVLVPESAATAAREVLRESDLYLYEQGPPVGRIFSFKFTLLAICLLLGVLALLVWLLFGLLK